MRMGWITVMGLLLLTGCGPSDGLHTEYYNNDQKKEEGVYKDGKQEGKWTYYWRNGKVQVDAYYTKGEPDKVWTFHDNKGKPIAEGTYKNGKMWNGTFVRYVMGTMKFITVKEGGQTTD